MAEADDEVTQIFQEMMQRCQQERKSKTSTTVRDLAQKLEITENYLSSIENGREIPSLRTFLKYLLLIGFDIEPLLRLQITDSASEKPGSRDKSMLIDKIYSLDDDQVLYLAEQAKLAELYKVKSKKKN